MDKLAISSVNSHVSDIDIAGEGVEEYQIAGLELAAGHGHAVRSLGAGSPTDVIAKMVHNILGKAGTIKASGAVTPPYIRDPKELFAVGHDLIPQGAGGGGILICPKAGGILAKGKIVAGNIADHISKGNLIPTSFYAKDGHNAAVTQRIDQGIFRTGAAADV